MTSRPAVVARAVRGGYAGEGAREVLRGLDLEVARGEMVAVVGPNGSGKTTLLRCLAGTLPPTSGEVELLGRPLAAWRRSELARSLAVLPQSVALPDGFRVAELVAMGRAPHARRLFGETAEDEAAVWRALAEADALELANRFAGELSGGERQRVLVAMAFAQEPDLVLLDEPTLHLDLAHQAALLATVSAYRRRRGLTVLAVLHDLNLALAHAPRVVVLEEGRIVADGQPQAVLRAGLVRRVFGVGVEEVWTTGGRRYLVPEGQSDRPGAPASADEVAAVPPGRSATDLA